MKNSTLSLREGFLVVFLLVLVTAVAYNIGFYQPLQDELATVSRQTQEIEEQIAGSTAKIASMNTMRAELDAIFADPDREITEIAPYDNKEVVLNQLNGILRRSEEYSLHFAEPSIQADGTVRRNVIMHFRCADYASAKAILQSLTQSRWRCLVSNLSVIGTGDVMQGTVEVDATITFFESTNLIG